MPLVQHPLGLILVQILLGGGLRRLRHLGVLRDALQLPVGLRQSHRRMHGLGPGGAPACGQSQGHGHTELKSHGESSGDHYRQTRIET